MLNLNKVSSKNILYFLIYANIAKPDFMKMPQKNSKERLFTARGPSRLINVPCDTQNDCLELELGKINDHRLLAGHAKPVRRKNRPCVWCPGQSAGQTARTLGPNQESPESPGHLQHKCHKKTS